MADPSGEFMPLGKPVGEITPTIDIKNHSETEVKC